MALSYILYKTFFLRNEEGCTIKDTWEGGREGEGVYDLQAVVIIHVAVFFPTGKK